MNKTFLRGSSPSALEILALFDRFSIAKIRNLATIRNAIARKLMIYHTRRRDEFKRTE